MSTALHGYTASGLSANAAAGWMIQRRTPNNAEIRAWGSGLSISTDWFGARVGGGSMLSASNPTTPGVYVGLGVGAGPSASFNYEVFRR